MIIGQEQHIIGQGEGRTKKQAKTAAVKNLLTQMDLSTLPPLHRKKRKIDGSCGMKDNGDTKTISRSTINPALPSHEEVKGDQTNTNLQVNCSCLIVANYKICCKT